MKKIAIVGGGPAGVFVAHSLRNEPVEITVFEKGLPVELRHCPAQKTGACKRCKPCAILCGFAGGGALSDGKGLFTWGGMLSDILGKDGMETYFARVYETYMKYATMANVIPNVYDEENSSYVLDLKSRAEKVGMDIEVHKITHFGSDGAPKIYFELQKDLEKKNVRILYRTEVLSINTKEKKVRYKNSKKTQEEYFDIIVLAPGRVGGPWLERVLKENGIRCFHKKCTVGFRAELPSIITQKIDKPYETKFRQKMTREIEEKIGISIHGLILALKTFCQCPEGEVIAQGDEDGTTVNGHSYLQFKTKFTNMSILVDLNPEIIGDPVKYMKKIVKESNSQGGGNPISQTFKDFKAGIPSTLESFDGSTKKIYPGDFTKVFADDIQKAVVYFCEMINLLVPEFTEKLVLHGIETKPVNLTIENISENMEIAEDIFIAGDGANLSHGLFPASASGIYTAECILKKLWQEVTD